MSGFDRASAEAGRRLAIMTDVRNKSGDDQINAGFAAQKQVTPPMSA
jgi:hypothetical protein